MRPHGRQGAGADARSGAEADRGAAGGGRRRRADPAACAHRRGSGKPGHFGYRRERQALSHRRAHGGGLLPREERHRAGHRARRRLRGIRRHGVVRDRHAGSRLCQEIFRSHSRKVSAENAGLQLLAVLQLEAQPRRRQHREIPARARRDGLQVPVHHPSRVPFAQLLDVRAGLRLRAQQHERLRRAAAEGIRRRREGLYRGEAPARGRHQLLRRDHAGGHRRHGIDHGAARLYGGRAILRRQEESEAGRRVSASAKVIPVHERRAYLPRDVARAVLEGFDKHYRLFRDASVRARALFERAAWAQMRELARERIQMYDLRVQVLGSLLFRKKAAYIVGRIINGQRELPFAALVLQNRHGELYLDALLAGESQLLVLFSFARAYFFVDMEVPAACVSFLRWLMPKKPRAEIYMAVGLAKQGKTLFYRDLHYHLRHSSDRFVVAPGIKGLVMLVFTLPSFPYVFKVIRDRFAPPKDIDRQTVKDKYLLVKLHDRVGRMADTLEYSLVALPLERFEPALVDELRREIGSQLEFDGDKLVIGHVYIERRMRPLNLHVEELRRDGDRARLRRTLRDYGDAIKELAGAGIFPGDMLLKNFGVTRHERIVFYDYDEIAPMTDVVFRCIPPPRDYDDEIAAEPYWSMGPTDVFPEQFERFLVGDPGAREMFYEYHRDLLDPAFWLSKQERVRAGFQDDVFPYPAEIRFPRASACLASPPR